ncbi:acetyltransferase [Coraliomargarita parva]|uniref:acetyltransferase n=1 Tax=Coraliomargarita parva TaxID=3014050 RepID=UPI0022B42ACD|nr:acetyltransferase [Coraliomargarita parva]
MKSLYIIGAGGFGREVYAWAMQHPDAGQLWNIAGFLDDNPTALDGFEYPVGVVGTVDGFVFEEDALFLCAVGTSEIRKSICERMRARGAQFISLVHPSVVCGQNVSLGKGVIVCPQAVLTSDVRIGDFVIINCHSSAGHDVQIGAWTTVSGHCDLTGHTRLGEGVFLGSGARIIPGKTVGDGAVIGAGAVVIRSVQAGQKVFGNPARVFG